MTALFWNLFFNNRTIPVSIKQQFQLSDAFPQLPSNISIRNQDPVIGGFHDRSIRENI